MSTAAAVQMSDPISEKDAIQWSFGGRLREERERLGLTQAQMGAKTKVSMESQGNYESGRRFPDARYLSRATEAGVDVPYVLTGVRSQQLSELPASYEVRKARIVQLLDDLDEEGLREVEQRAVKERMHLAYRKLAEQIQVDDDGPQTDIQDA